RNPPAAAGTAARPALRPSDAVEELPLGQVNGQRRVLLLCTGGGLHRRAGPERHARAAAPLVPNRAYIVEAAHIPPVERGGEAGSLRGGPARVGRGPERLGREPLPLGQRGFVRSGNVAESKPPLLGRQGRHRREVRLP